MKDKLKQIEFVDKKLLPIYGFESVLDYNTRVSLNDIKNNKNILKKLNDLLPQLKEIFIVKDFSLHKTDNQIKTHTQAHAILKKCLQSCNILFDVIQDNKINYVRLISKNNILENYINIHKMADIRETNSLFPESKLEGNSEKHIKMDYNELINNIKKETWLSYYFPLFLANRSITAVQSSEITKTQLNLTEILTDIKGLTIEFVAESKNGINLLNQEYIDKTFYGCKYEIVVNGDIIIVSGILEKGKILCSDCILPFTTSVYSGINLNIYYSLPDKILRNVVDIKISMNKIDFYKKTSNQLLNSNWVEVPVDNNIFIFGHGMIVKKENETFQKNPYEKVIDKIDGIEFNTPNNYKCIRLKKVNSEDLSHYELIAALIYGYDICVQYIKNKPFKPLYYTKTDTSYIFSSYLSRDCDAVSNISINFPEPIKCENIRIEIRNCGFQDKLETIKYFDFVQSNCIYENNDKCVKLNYPENNCISLSSMGTKVTIEISNKNDIINILQNISLSYDIYMLAGPIREKIVRDGSDFIL